MSKKRRQAPRAYIVNVDSGKPKKLRVSEPAAAAHRINNSAHHGATYSNANTAVAVLSPRTHRHSVVQQGHSSHIHSDFEPHVVSRPVGSALFSLPPSAEEAGTEAEAAAAAAAAAAVAEAKAKETARETAKETAKAQAQTIPQPALREGRLPTSAPPRALPAHTRAHRRPHTHSASMARPLQTSRDPASSADPAARRASVSIPVPDPAPTHAFAHAHPQANPQAATSAPVRDSLPPSVAAPAPNDDADGGDQGSAAEAGVTRDENRVGVRTGSDNDMGVRSNVDTPSDEGKPTHSIDATAPSDDHSEPDSLLILQCAHCWAIVADTLNGFIFDDTCDIVSLRAASKINLDDELKMATGGFDLGCTYRRASCKSCDATLGRVYQSTGQELDHRRGMYTINTARVVVYRVGNSKTPDGDDAASLGATAMPIAPNLRLPYASIDAFEDLDSHVNTVTDAVNTITDAIKHSRTTVTELRSNLDGTRRTVAEGETTVSKMQNVLLIWDKRMHLIDELDRNFGRMVPAVRSMEKRMHRTEKRLLLMEKTISMGQNGVPRITDVNRRGAPSGRTTPASSTPPPVPMTERR